MNALSRNRRYLVRVLFVAVQLYAGQVVAQQCTLHLSDANLDLGQIPYPDAPTERVMGALFTVGTRFVTLNASCPEPTVMSLMLKGERQANQFRFAPSGQMTVDFDSALLDGQAVDLAALKTLEEPLTGVASSLRVAPGDRVVAVSGGRPAQGSHLSLQISVTSQIALTELSGRDRTALEGRLLIELRGN